MKLLERIGERHLAAAVMMTIRLAISRADRHAPLIGGLTHAVGEVTPAALTQIVVPIGLGVTADEEDGTSAVAATTGVTTLMTAGALAHGRWSGVWSVSKPSATS